MSDDTEVGHGVAPATSLIPKRRRPVNASWSSMGGWAVVQPAVPTGWEGLLAVAGVANDDAAARIVERPGPGELEQAAAIREFVRKHKTHWFVPLKVLAALGEDVVFGDEWT
jgi:hypothetical protein